MGDLKPGSKIDWNAMPNKEAVDLAMKLFNFDLAEARQYVAIATGKIKIDYEDPEKAIYY